MAEAVDYLFDYEREQILLEYSDRVIFGEAEEMLKEFITRNRLPSGTILAGFYQRSRAVQSGSQLFELEDRLSFRRFLEDRILRSHKRGYDNEEQFYRLIQETLFGDSEGSLKRASHKILLDAGLKKELITKREKEKSQVFLFHEWSKHIYLKALYLSKQK